MSHNTGRLPNTLRRPWAVWLALCMALLGALAPTVSHAVTWARGGNAGLVEVCTTLGPRWMALPTLAGASARAVNGSVDTPQAEEATTPLSGQPNGPLSAAVLDHCPFCLQLADRVAPPPQAWQMPLTLAQASAAPAAPQVHFFPAFYAHTPPPRGPPSLF